MLEILKRSWIWYYEIEFWNAWRWTFSSILSLHIILCRRNFYQQLVVFSIKYRNYLLFFPHFIQMLFTFVNDVKNTNKNRKNVGIYPKIIQKSHIFDHFSMMMHYDYFYNTSYMWTENLILCEKFWWKIKKKRLRSDSSLLVCRWCALLGVPE